MKKILATIIFVLASSGMAYAASAPAEFSISASVTDKFCFSYWVKNLCPRLWISYSVSDIQSATVSRL